MFGVVGACDLYKPSSCLSHLFCARGLDFFVPLKAIGPLSLECLRTSFASLEVWWMCMRGVSRRLILLIQPTLFFILFSFFSQASSILGLGFCGFILAHHNYLTTEAGFSSSRRKPEHKSLPRRHPSRRRPQPFQHRIHRIQYRTRNTRYHQEISRFQRHLPKPKTTRTQTQKNSHLNTIRKTSQHIFLTFPTP